MTSANVHGMSDRASAAFSRLVPCPAPACDGGTVHGDECERCGGEGRVMPYPAWAIKAEPSAVCPCGFVFTGSDNGCDDDAPELCDDCWAKRRTLAVAVVSAVVGGLLEAPT